MSARNIMQRALCVAAIGQAASTFDDPTDRKRFILDLFKRGVLTEQTADLLIESYGLENV